MNLDLAPDGRVLVFTLGVSLLATLLFGTLPAVLVTGVKPDGQRAWSGRFRPSVSRLLVVAQVALSSWLLIGAGLLLRSLNNLRAADLGLDRAHLSTFHVVPEAGLEPAGFRALHSEVVARLATLPRAKAVASSSLGLFSKGGLTSPARVPASAVEPEGDRDMYVGYVSPGFFRALGMELALGRDFGQQDTPASPKVGIISEAVARHYFGQRSPIGEVLYLPGIDAQNRYIPFSEGLAEARRIEIAGVVRDAFDRGPRLEPAHRIYLPMTQYQRFADTFYVATDGDPEALARPGLDVLGEFSTRLRTEETHTLEWQLNQNYPFEILGARLLTFFGVLALVLAAVGLFGVMSYAVSRRTAEIGVRMALGSPPRGVRAMILRETLFLVVAGIALGVPAALLTTQYLQSLLYGLSPDDPDTVVTACAVLAVTALLAGFVPAWRASRVNPIAALRHE